MKTTQDTNRDTKSKRDRRSPDGEWRSFPKVPNLLQYVSTGTYYGRVKVNGKLIRRSLNAKTFEEAKLLLHDFLTREAKRRHVVGAPETFGEARGLYESSLDHDRTLSPASRRYRRNCLKRLLASWPGLDGVRPRSITRLQCEKWAHGLSGELDAQYFNNILGTLKAVLTRAGIDDDGSSPLAEVKRMGVVQNPPALPETAQFSRIIAEMETSGAGQQQDCADFARFLAYSGCRLSEARAATWADVDLAGGWMTVHNAKVRRARNWQPTRRVPIIPDLRKLLERLQADKPAAEVSICTIGECEKSLARACRIVGIPKLTHHDLRHLFATRCIESGVDIPTVSRWLGHSDGGALAMKVYGHLRDQHSQEMAKAVTFAQEGAQ
jgi:integrase